MSNSIRTHGLNASTLYLPEDSGNAFLVLYNGLRADIRPTGELQLQFFEQLVHASWQQNLARRQLAAAQEQASATAIAAAHRVITQYERSFARALKELKALQTDAALRAAPQNEPIRHLPRPIQTKALTTEAARLTKANAKTDAEARRQLLEAIAAAFQPPPPERLVHENEPTPRAA